jgi:multiple sugar transport system substrate-binding protein
MNWGDEQMRAHHRVVVLVVLFAVLAGEILAQSAVVPLPTYRVTDLTTKAGVSQPAQSMKTNSDWLVAMVDVAPDKQTAVFMNAAGSIVKSFPLGLPGIVAALCFDPQGDLCVFATEYVQRQAKSEVEAIKRSMVLFGQDGRKLKTVNLGDIAYDKSNPWYLLDTAVDATGRIYGATARGVEVWDSQGSAGRQLASYRAQGIDVDSDGMVYVAGYSTGENKSFLEKIDPVGRKQVWRTQLGDIPAALRLDRRSKSLDVLDGRYVTTFDLDGKLVARVLDVTRSEVQGQYLQNASFAIGADGDLFFVVRKPGSKDSDPWSVALLRYSRTTQSASKKSTLTISHDFWYDRYPDLVVNAFEKSNPDWTVSYRRTYEEKDLEGTGYTDSLATVTTELLAGRGADIVVLSQLPWRSFVDNDLLVNLDQLDSTEHGSAFKDLRANVLNAFRYRGALFVLPAAFSQQVLFANKRTLDAAKVAIKDTTWTWHDFFAAAATLQKDTNSDGVSDRFALPSMEARDLFFGYILNTVYDGFVDTEKKQVRFTDPKFGELLAETKAFAERNAKENKFGVDKWIQGAQTGSIVFSFGGLEGPLEPQAYGSLFKGEAKVLSLPGIGGKGDITNSYWMVGINKASRNVSKAWEFLKLLVRDDLQDSQNLFGTPLNNNAYAKHVQQWKEASAHGLVSGGFGEGSVFTYAPLSDREVNLVSSYFSRITRCVYRDSRLSSLIGQELKDFWSGARTASDVCSTLQKKAMTYLQE